MSIVITKNNNLIYFIPIIKDYDTNLMKNNNYNLIKM